MSLRIGIEDLKGHILPLLGGPLNISDHALNGVDLIMFRIGTGRSNEIFCHSVVDLDRVSIMRKEVDRRRHREDEVIFLDPGSGEREIVEFKMNLKSGTPSTLLPTLPSGQIEEKEFLRGDEIFLKDPVAGKGMGGIRDEGLLIGKANGL
jgi:hypothetical protein